MYGSDWPSYLPTGTWKEALAAFTQSVGAQTLEDREQILGATAKRFYRLAGDSRLAPPITGLLTGPD